MKKSLFPVIVILILSIVLPAMAQDVTFHLTFTGDCTLGSQEYLRQKKDSFDSYISRYGVGYPFEHFKELFLKDDWTLVNLECVLADSAQGEDKKQTYRFRGPTSFTDILTSSGIDMVTLANNHTDDYGEAGLKSTKEALTAAGIPYCQNEDLYILERDGIRIAFLGIVITDYDTYGKELNNRIAKLKSEENCQFVVVSFHYGWEYSYVHNKKQRLTSHEVILSGADLVVGTHPHSVQGVEVYKNRLILYSLGNFSFGGNFTVKARSLEAYVARVDVTFRDGALLSQQLNILPIHTSGTNPQNDFQPCLLTGQEAQAVVDRIQGDTPFELKPYQEGVGAVQDPVAAK